MLFARSQVTFESDFSISESVERLSAATRRPSFAAFLEQTAMGKVDAKRVRLVRVIPYVRNSFKPVFTGAFEESGGGTVLRGSFGMQGVVKVFMSCWFGALAAFALLIAWQAVKDRPDAWKGVLFCAGMGLVGAGLVALGKWLARNDEAWLSAVIRAALTRPGR
jgi:hypothetical protein